MFSEPVGWGMIIGTIALILIAVAFAVVAVNKKTKQLKDKA